MVKMRGQKEIKENIVKKVVVIPYIKKKEWRCNYYTNVTNYQTVTIHNITLRKKFNSCLEADCNIN